MLTRLGLTSGQALWDGVSSEMILSGMNFGQAPERAGAAAAAQAADDADAERVRAAVAGISSAQRMRDIAAFTRKPDFIRSAQYDRAFGREAAEVRALPKTGPNDDPYGDGDQSNMVKSQRDEMPPNGMSHRLRTVWGNGADYNPSCMSPLLQACMAGDLASVRSFVFMVEAECGGPGTAESSSALAEALNRRETLLRHHALLAVVCGSRQAAAGSVASNYIALARLLIARGSSLTARDVAGYSVIHHCTTCLASETSLAILLDVAAALRARGQLNAALHMHNRVGTIPLTESLVSGRPDVTRVLIQLGSDPAFDDRLQNNWFSPGAAQAFQMSRGDVIRAMTAARPGGGLQPGDEAELYGLKRKELNGSRGRVVDILPGARYAIRVDGAAADAPPISIAVENVRRPFATPTTLPAGADAKYVDVPMPNSAEAMTTMMMGAQAVPGMQPPNRGEVFLLKVQGALQTPQHFPLSVYDGSRAVSAMIAPSGATRAAHAALVAAMIASPECKGAKTYLFAMRLAGTSGDVVRVQTSPRPPMQNW